MTAPQAGSEPLLDLRDLGVQFATEDGVVRAVDNVSSRLQDGLAFLAPAVSPWRSHAVA